MKDKIMNWNKESIYELLKMIEGLQQEDPKLDTIDLSSLPTDDFEKWGIGGLEHYPIWSVDKHGMALVGDTADKVESVDRILGISLNQKLYDSRKLLGLTQKEMAEKIGITENHLWKIENGIAKGSKLIEKSIDNIMKNEVVNEG